MGLLNDGYHFKTLVDELSACVKACCGIAGECDDDGQAELTILDLVGESGDHGVTAGGECRSLLCR